MEEREHEKTFKGSFVQNCYVISIYDNMEDKTIETICQNTVSIAHARKVSGVIFNFINVAIIDTYTINLFIKTTKVIRLLGLRVVWTGLNPGVVSSLLDFNIDLDSIAISHDIQHGIDIINEKADNSR